MDTHVSAGAKVLPWSYSSLTAFETCPRRYYLTRIAKAVKEPQTEATTHGNETHKALERAVNGTAGLAPKYAQYQPIVERVKTAKGSTLTEHKFALTSAFKPTTYWADDAWVRGVIDLQILRQKSAVLIDYKTGKVKEDPDQLKLFAVVAFAQYPRIEVVHTGYAWVAYNKMDAETFYREQVPDIWADYLGRVKRMTSAAAKNDFPPKPSGLCKKWCPVGRQLCEFCGS